MTGMGALATSDYRPQCQQTTVTAWRVTKRFSPFIVVHFSECLLETGAATPRHPVPIAFWALRAAGSLSPSLNFDMAPPARHSDQLLVGRDHGEHAVEQPLAVRVTLAIHDALDVLLRNVLRLHIDEGVGEAVAGERVSAASPRAQGQPGES